MPTKKKSNFPRRRPPVYSKGQSFGGWTLVEKLGGGGNGQVWRVSRLGEPDRAMKLLRFINSESYERFRAETTALKALSGVDGITPMIDGFIPERIRDKTPWFVMPLAQSFEKYEVGRDPEALVTDFADLALTLSRLHASGISHRDIKPANILFDGKRLCLADFGLVKYPRRISLTRKHRDVGPKFTMAPEMRRFASAADGRRADVYSFSKTLWIALTKQALGFDGQYTVDSVLSLRNFLPKLYTTTLDQLLIECTDNDPSRRPSIDHVESRLREWIAVIADFHSQNLREWAEMQQFLFPAGSPRRATWTNIDAICTTLGQVARSPSLNHMFYPSGGGNTFSGASRASESGLIALRIGSIAAELLMPAKLTYESFGNDPAWNYFRLEASPIPPSGIEDAVDSEGIREHLTELYPGHYVPFHCWENGEYNNEPLPIDARPVNRYLKGSFVFFGTRSIYNLAPSTYDARHNKMSEEEFRMYIERNALSSGSGT